MRPVGADVRRWPAHALLSAATSVERVCPDDSPVHRTLFALLRRLPGGGLTPNERIRLGVRRWLASERRRPFRFANIGAHDGRIGDPLYRFIAAGGWEGLFVEPHPDNFRRLKARFQGVHGLRFERAAIAEQDGEVDLFFSTARRPAWHDQTMSLQRDLHRRLTRTPDEKIDCLRVPSKTLRTLFREHGIDALDVLLVDTEGHDGVIVQQLLETSVRPAIIAYESAFLEEHECDRLTAALKSEGYRVHRFLSDTLAVRGDPDAAGPQQPRVLFASYALAGHSAEMRVMASDLARRGVPVAFATQETGRSWFEGSGVEYLCWEPGTKSQDFLDWLRQRRKAASRERTLMGSTRTLLEAAVESYGAERESLELLLRSWRPTVVVTQRANPAVRDLAEDLSIPCVIHDVFLPVHWRPGSSFKRWVESWRWVRQAGAHGNFNEFARNLWSTTTAAQRLLKLRRRGRRTRSSRSDLRRHAILASVGQFENVDGLPSRRMRLVGPILSEQPVLTPRLRDWLDAGLTGGVVLVAFGSLVEATPDQVGRIAAGLGRLGVRTLWALKAHLHPVLPQTEGALICEGLPQLAVLTHPALRVFVSHCGGNSTHEALASGRPMLGMPFFLDQPYFARRILELGVGLTVDRLCFTADEIHDKVQRLLEEPSFARRARALASCRQGWNDRERAVGFVLQASAAGTADGGRGPWPRRFPVPEWITRAPKAELHVHLEGTATASRLVELARRRGEVEPDEQALRARLNHAGFFGFLRAFGRVSRFLQGPADYLYLLECFARDLAKQNVIYAEITLSAGLLQRNNRRAEETLEMLLESSTALEIGRGPVIRWILDADRHRGRRHVADVVELALRHRQAGVVAIGLGGEERLGPAWLFRRIFARARDAGLRVVVHAGEFCGPRSISSALDHLGATRIGHGLAAGRDPRLRERLMEQGVTVDTCPTSNGWTGALRKHTGSDGLDGHPLVRFHREGIRVTLNSDDPGLFQTSLSEEHARAHDMGLSVDELRSIGRNALLGAFCDAELRTRLLARFDGEWPVIASSEPGPGSPARERL